MCACVYNFYYLYILNKYYLYIHSVYIQRYYILSDELKFSIYHYEFSNELLQQQRFVHCKNKIAFYKRCEHISSLYVLDIIYVLALL